MSLVKGQPLTHQRGRGRRVREPWLQAFPGSRPGQRQNTGVGCPQEQVGDTRSRSHVFRKIERGPRMDLAYFTSSLFSQKITLRSFWAWISHVSQAAHWRASEITSFPVLREPEANEVEFPSCDLQSSSSSWSTKMHPSWSDREWVTFWPAIVF